ncbi:hypothetical protein AURDEDRAFT_117443 [Auricularia subglabra TFB-10046 SS5]|uniref:MYND-type domain-containing protein n=1 Tax=Auricularia subglabra (strain TFB-10046 / SS5) TaxID=717982 RepID=J0WSJ5_AURST|nr:hypothetical protein AURDEDRAFT_117443 [Auricularia subglabra TFB-10046 SS5]
MTLRGCVAFFRERLGLLAQGESPGDQRAALIVLLHRSLARRALSRMCGNHACGMTEASSAVKHKFQRCGRCMFTLYCSRNCQRQDWAEGVTHKSVCPLLSRIAAATGNFANYDGFEVAFLSCGFEREEENLLFRWAIAGHDDVPVPTMS